MNFLKKLVVDQDIIEAIKELDKSNSIESNLVNILKEIINIHALMIKGRILRVPERIIEKEIEKTDFSISHKNHFDTLVSYQKLNEH